MKNAMQLKAIVKNIAKDILSSLGQMYAGGGDFTTNIDGAGGEGTAQFASDAIEIYCG